MQPIGAALNRPGFAGGTSHEPGWERRKSILSDADVANCLGGPRAPMTCMSEWRDTGLTLRPPGRSQIILNFLSIF